MVGTLDDARIVEYFRNKSVLITGSTGFLKEYVALLVEKILRVQPGVRRIYLPVRAADSTAARRRVETEVVGKELFRVLREQHGGGFDGFISEKVVALAGDVTREAFGIDTTTLRDLQLADELHVIVNSAATTNFYERYDVALDVNVTGVKHMCAFAKKCPNLEVLLHVSTAYVAGEKQGLVQERPFRDGETLCDGTQLDMDVELRLAKDVKKQMEADPDSPPKAERKAMKDLGLSRARHFGWPNTYVFTKSMGEMVLGREMRGEGSVPVVIIRPSIITSVQNDPLPGWIEGARTIDTLIIGYAKQNLPCFLADLDLTMDVMPGDMVVNAMMAATAVHASTSSFKTSLEKKEPQPPVVYHVSSSLRHPAKYAVLYRTGIRYFEEHPWVGPDGRAMRAHKMRFLSNITAFHLFMMLKYRLPIELLRLLSILCCGLFGLATLYNDLDRKYRFVMQLVDVYGPFSLFKGCFDDVNLNRLRLAMAENGVGDAGLFNFDPKTVDWDDYFFNVHIPGVMKYVLK